MTNHPAATVYACGDRVRIVSAPDLFGCVAELRGPLGPYGTQIYRVKIDGAKSKPVHVEVREDQLEAIGQPKGS